MPVGTAVRGTVDSVTSGARNFFEWLVNPAVIMLWPRRNAWVVRNLANIISTLRLPVSVAVVVSWVYPAYVSRDLGSLYASLLVMFVILMSDGIDGALARGLDAVSRYGKAVDPLADKVFYIAMTACLVIGGWQIVPQEVAVVMVVFMVPAVYYELRLVAIAIATDRECRKRDAAEPVGANMWGKAKFVLQATAGFVGFGLPWVSAGFTAAMGLIVLALPLAHMSLRGHQVDLEAIRLKPLIRVELP